MRRQAEPEDRDIGERQDRPEYDILGRLALGHREPSQKSEREQGRSNQKGKHGAHWSTPPLPYRRRPNLKWWDVERGQRTVHKLCSVRPEIQTLLGNNLPYFG